MNTILNTHKKLTLGITISLSALLVIYIATSLYFIKHLYFGSKINGIDVSGKTVEEIQAQMTSEINKYTLNIKERGGKKEQIKAGEINLKCELNKQLNDYKDKQNPVKWISAIFNKKNYEMSVKISYDKDKLKQKVDNLSCLNDSNIIQPKEPVLNYLNNTFEIQKEIKGTKIDKSVLFKSITDSINGEKSTLDLDSANCYINPKYTSKSEKVVKDKDILNKYISSKVTYNIGSNKVDLDGSTINKWLKVDDDFNASIDEGKVKQYMTNLAYAYNTAGTTRSFHATSGNTVSVSGGDYGWQININKETENLINTIKEGQTIAKEPAYSQTALSHENGDLGNTYVEVDMTKQHLWFYKNGTLIVEGDVVTGNLALNTATPPGIYRLKDREKDYTLKGEDYSTPVSFWMPFNLGIGIHDATWRSEFGKDIYKTNGSHGCVNAPYNVAQTIYQNIQIGTPVVCFY